MRLGVLETGAPPSELNAAFGDYPAMFRRLLGPGYHYETFDVVAGRLPDHPQACAAYVITGSPASAYEDAEWIARLKDFLRAAKGHAALVGVCFGHQIMAEAFGGKVIKSPNGWGIGMHSYRVREAQRWMDPVAEIRAPASHQDQVVEAPEGAVAVAGSDFCPFGMLAWTDQPAISIQLHPEFEPAYAKALIESRRSRRIGEEEAAQAIATLEGPDDRARLAEWIRRFIADPKNS
ncbi:glutamine amidotransferase-related protein [Phenylobacterium sp.]|uniref:glutamine amidotransferase-related protein n=1 Tax=Phenylobacterium sp. TaxID=1871053 RepID=UPI002E310EF0|nr:type 1 glutamine amidotransferase [Phenylobacterium sp.]HEX2561924.1 type 1 glutamine amidotransferase [Phenylobacterium sp.]